MNKIFKFILQILVLFALYEGCSYIVTLLSLPLPATIISMLVFLILLISKIIRQDQISQAADTLLKYMPIMFVPAGVDILKYVDIIKNDALKLVFILVFTTILVFFATAFTVRVVKHMMERRQVHE